MNRKLRILLLSLGLLFVLLGVPVWLTVREVQQQRRDKALIAAIKQNDTASVVSLLEQGADPNARDTPDEIRPFWQFLLDKLKGKHPQPDISPTALIVALEFRVDADGTPTVPPENTSLIRALLDKGADVNARAEHGYTPLMLAEPRKRETVQLLLERNADVNAKTNRGDTILIFAALSKDASLARAVLNRNANINAQDDSGATALMWAAGINSIETVKVLLERHADINIKNNKDHTALSFAQKKHHLEIVALLKKAGAKQ